MTKTSTTGYSVEGRIYERRDTAERQAQRLANVRKAPVDVVRTRDGVPVATVGTCEPTSTIRGES